jgi:hypothetical protein
MEWAMNTEDKWAVGDTGMSSLCSLRYTHNQVDYESVPKKFDAFLQRSSAYGSVLAPTCNSGYFSMPSSSAAASTSAQQPPLTPVPESSGLYRRRLILIEDLPNITHLQTRTAFHDALLRFLETKTAVGTPLVIILSDEGRRVADISSSNFSRNEAFIKFEIRSVLPRSLLDSRYSTELR